VEDGALAVRVRAGDRAAFAELYGEYSERIFGFCVVLLRDADEAADATHDTFVVVLQRIGQLRDLEKLDAWLFAVARHVCYRRLDRRKRVAPSEIAPDALVVADDGVDVVASAEATALVHAAAAGLNDRDRAVLYLNVMEGLEGVALAAAVGESHANPYSLLHRAKAQLQRSIGVLVVARFGRRRCAALAGLVADWDGRLTPLTRKRLGRLIDQCDACRTTQARLLPVSTLAAVPLFATPVARDLTAARPGGELHALTTRHLLPAGAWRRDGFPPDEGTRARRRRAVAMIAAAVVLLLLLVAGDLAFLSRGHPRVAVAVPTVPAPAPRIRVDAKHVLASTTTTSSTSPRTSVPTPAPGDARTTATATTRGPVVTAPPRIGPPATAVTPASSPPPPKPPPVTTPNPKPTVPPTLPPTTVPAPPTTVGEGT
jgi:RNA polymerase sigma factor (sigma-70 family)